MLKLSIQHFIIITMNTNQGPDQKGSGTGVPDNVDSSSTTNSSRKNKFARKATTVLSGTSSKEAKFEGREDKLNGHIYDLSSKQSDMYTKTTKEIAEYIGRTFKYGDDTKRAVLTLATITFNEPNYPGDTATKPEMKIWEKEIDEHMKMKNHYKQNMKSAYNLIWGQISEALRTKLEAMNSHENIANAADCIGLLKNIKNISYNYQSEKLKRQALHEAKRRFYVMYQDRTMSVQDYFDKFNNLVKVIEHCGGSIVDEQMLIDELEIETDPPILLINATDADKLKARTSAKEKALAIAFILSADRNRYGKMVEDMENNYLHNIDTFPESLIKSYTLMLHYKQDPRNSVKVVGTVSDGISFATTNDSKKDGKQAKDISHITCFHCNEKGHYASNCPNKKKEGTTNLQVDEKNVKIEHLHLQDGFISDDENENITTSFQFITTDIISEHTEICQAQGRVIPSSWIILDNGSTVDIFTNKNLLTNIRTTKTVMNVRCNAGVTQTNLQGDLEGYGTVWYNPNGIANILSLSRVQEKYRVTFDSNVDGSFFIHKPDGTHRIFSKSKSGLYYLDTNDKLNGIGLFTTVEQNQTKFTRRELQGATLARKIQNLIGRPSTRTFTNIVNKNLLKNCPITQNDINNAEKIFGMNIGSLKGKTVWQNTDHIKYEHANIPSDIIADCAQVTLCIDIMFVNRIPFLVSISRKLKFGTVELLGSRSALNVMKSVRNIKHVYERRGFTIGVSIMDNEFENLRGKFMELGILLNVTARNEHVPEIERYIRIIKERARSIFNTLPYKSIPGIMIVEMIQLSVFWLNSFPAADSASDTLSPRYIVGGFSIDYAQHCKIEFGSYVQVHEEHDNSMVSRTTGAIALRPTGNVQGGYFFMSLTTGRKLIRSHWTELPVPMDVVNRVHDLARKGNANRGLMFADRDGQLMVEDPQENIDEDENNVHELTDDEYNENNTTNDDANIEYTDDDTNTADEIVENDTNTADEIVENESEYDDTTIEDDNIDEINENSENESIVQDNLEPIIEEENEDDLIENQNQAIVPDIETQMNQRYGERTGKHNLRPRKPVDYKHLFIGLEQTVFTQYSIKRGLKEFGDEAANAVISELKQLDLRNVIKAVHHHTLSGAQKSAALSYLMFIKQKRCGKIKARGCADGRKQRIYKSKEESSSPTVAIESLMISCTIDAHERRFVITTDIPGAFMHPFMDEIVYMKIEGALVDLLIQMNQQYKEFVYENNGKKVIYVLLEKALYGTLQAALLFWKDLSTTLINLGFVLNPYDQCVANKTINGSQCTVLWHVDDIKISHVEESVVEQILASLEKKYGIEAPLAITRGKIHDYLGMVLDYTKTGTCKINMKDYVMDILEELPADMNGFATTPAADHLFEVDEKQESLSEEQSVFFHHNTAKLLFLSKRARPDIQTAVAFLTTRVKSPDIDDLKKLSRVMRYLRGTVDLTLLLEADDLTVVKWWVDGSYAVHPDMKSHTGGTMSLGKSSLYSASTRQKLNTKSSTEAELVGVADIMPQILWTKYFLESQGYETTPSIIYQDNQSAILLEKNGTASSGKRTRHVNIRYFFVADRVKSNEVKIEFCPTGDMRADYFTKPLQGALFRRFRAEILNMEINK